MTAEGVEATEVGERPDLDDVVPATRDEDGVLGSGGEANAGNPIGVRFTIKSVDAVTLDIPDLELGVATTRQDVTIVRGESTSQNVVGVAEELADDSTGLEVPETERAIPRSREGEFAAVGESDIRDESLVAFKTTSGDGRSVILGVAFFRSSPGDEGVIARTRDNLDRDNLVSKLRADEGSDSSTMSVELTAELDWLCHYYYKGFVSV